MMLREFVDFMPNNAEDPPSSTAPIPSTAARARATRPGESQKPTL